MNYTLQDKFLIPSFTNKVDGLGYREVKANTIDNNSLIIENDLIDKLVKFLQSKIKDLTNMAIFLNQHNSSFTFEGFKFYLFNRSGAMIKGDEDFEQNIFSVVQELPYIFKYKRLYNNY